MHALHHPRQLLLLLLPALQLRRDGEIRLCLCAAPQVHSRALRLPAHRLRQSVSTHARTAKTRSLIAPLQEVRVQSVNAERETPQTQIKLSEGLIT